MPWPIVSVAVSKKVEENRCIAEETSACDQCKQEPCKEHFCEASTWDDNYGNNFWTAAKDSFTTLCPWAWNLFVVSQGIFSDEIGLFLAEQANITRHMAWQLIAKAAIMLKLLYQNKPLSSWFTLNAGSLIMFKICKPLLENLHTDAPITMDTAIDFCSVVDSFKLWSTSELVKLYVSLLTTSQPCLRQRFTSTRPVGPVETGYLRLDLYGSVSIPYFWTWGTSIPEFL